MAISNSSTGFTARKSSQGYTFIEMVVAVAIIVVLASVAVGYSSVTARQMTHLSAQSQIVSILNHAKSLSQSFLFTPPAGKRICGYGVNVNKVTSELLVFQDLAPDTDDCDSASRAYESEEELEGRLNHFTLDTRILEFISSSDFTSPDIEDVVFIPPDPTVLINNDEILNSGSIIVRIIGTATVFDARVNTFGQITVK